MGSLTPAAPSKLLTLQTLRLVDVPLSQTTRVHSRTTNLTALLLTFKDLFGAELDLDRSQIKGLQCKSGISNVPLFLRTAKTYAFQDFSLF